MQVSLPTLSLVAAERRLVELALSTAGSIVGAAQLLGITNHAIKRRIIFHRIEWPRSAPLPEIAVTETAVSLDSFNLVTAERKLVELALKQSGSINAAAVLLDTNRHAVKRRITKHGIRWQSVHPAHAHVQMGGGL